ncbi:MAG TPA: phage baseplate assembly protein V [Gaiellaceae bacterium]
MSQRNAVYPATVLQSRDPRGRGRLKVSVPAFDQEVWARHATLLTGARRGTWFVPDVGDEVLVAFEGGDARKPVVVGALWNQSDRPPDSNPERTLLRTKHGATIVFDDGTGAIEVQDSNGNAVRLAADGVTITAAATVKVLGPMVEIAAAVARFTGVVQCDTLIANSVVASSYTPGAGNLA